jgi:hypothetical protein
MFIKINFTKNLKLFAKLDRTYSKKSSWWKGGGQLSLIYIALGIISSAGFLYYWGNSGYEWGTTEDDI